MCIFGRNIHLLGLFSLWFCWCTKNSLFADSQWVLRCADFAGGFNKLFFLTLPALMGDEDGVIVECGKTTRLYWWLLANKLNWGRKRECGKSRFLCDTTWKWLCWDLPKAVKEVHLDISIEVIFSASIELTFVLLVLICMTETD